ncbi:MAG: DNA polymerase III subunit beta [Bacteroidota bacterium]
MKFLVSSTSLLKQLQMVAGVLNSSNTLPILDNFLFKIEQNELTISASDLETTMITKMSIESEDSGMVAVPAKLLLDTLKSFPEMPMTFIVDDKTFAIEVSTEQGKYKLSGYNGEEFPKVMELENPSKVELNAEVLAYAINKTIFATGNDDLRPVMSGIYFEFGNDGLRFVATDAHRLVRYTRSDIKADKNTGFIVPKKPLSLLKNILGTTNADVKVEYNETNVQFTFDNVTMVSRLIDGKYPNYESVIPKENPNKMTISKGTFLNSIKRVSIFANKTTHQVKLGVKGSELEISAEDIDFSNQANERLGCNYNGEDIEIGFNSKFIMDMVSNLDSENVNLEMSGPSKAGIIVPAEPENENEDILMLVMPIMLNN